MKINEITVDRDYILNLIKKDSKPFLNRIGGDFSYYAMYRGMENETQPFIRKQVRLNDRKPMSSAQIKHARYNQYFEETFGQPFRNSLHVSGEREMAEYYGNVYVIFPIGNFDWLWSPEVKDMALDIRWPMVGGQINVPPSQDAVTDKLDTLDYHMNSDLKGAILTGFEIMIRCKEYYAIDLQTFNEITV